MRSLSFLAATLTILTIIHAAPTSNDANVPVIIDRQVTPLTTPSSVTSTSPPVSPIVVPDSCSNFDLEFPQCPPGYVCIEDSETGPSGACIRSIIAKRENTLEPPSSCSSETSPCPEGYFCKIDNQDCLFLFQGACDLTGTCEPFDAPSAKPSTIVILEDPTSSASSTSSDVAVNPPNSLTARQIDPRFVCSTHLDCIILAAQNCCGYYPTCARRDARFGPPEDCQNNADICGYPPVWGCDCISGSCVVNSTPNIAPVKRSELPPATSSERDEPEKCRTITSPCNNEGICEADPGAACNILVHGVCDFIGTCTHTRIVPREIKDKRIIEATIEVDTEAAEPCLTMTHPCSGTDVCVPNENATCLYKVHDVCNLVGTCQKPSIVARQEETQPRKAIEVTNQVDSEAVEYCRTLSSPCSGNRVCVANKDATCTILVLGACDLLGTCESSQLHARRVGRAAEISDHPVHCRLKSQPCPLHFRCVLSQDFNSNDPDAEGVCRPQLRGDTLLPPPKRHVQRGDRV